MIQNAYVQRTFRKIEKSLERYSPYLFIPVGEAEKAYALTTEEHLRLPPEIGDMKLIEKQTKWGGEYSNLWLRTQFTVPECADGKILCAIPDADAVEILCFKNGKPAGIINSKNRFLGGDHSFMFVSPCAKAGETVDLAFECYAGHTCFGTQPGENYRMDEHAVGEFSHVYAGIRFLVIDTVIRDFVFDVACALQIAKMPEDNFAAMNAYECLMNAFPYFIQDADCADAEEMHASAEKVRECLKPVLEKRPSEMTRGKVRVIGHSHMDTAWLWPISETVRKCARTYSQALTLMDMYPEYTFIQSSALHLDWMRRYYPDIFEGIRARVKEGRYEPNGGVWVECDCNITGGEAMVRQFLYGQRFTQKYLDYRSDSFWLPDTFGYNAAIPQIMQGCGVKYFYTTKIGWNDLTRFPTNTFVWRGLDGTEVISHLNATHLMPDPATLAGVVRDMPDRRTNNTRLAAYGFGDGGGGPTYGMLEYLKRARNIAGMPEIEPSTISAFMQEVEKRRDKLPVYDGELYLELHRGTLTKMHDVKRNNRLAEIALYNMELLNVMSGKPAHEKHDEYYQVLLKNQFHDILPGTCIPKVYEIEVPEMNKLISDVRAAALGFAEGMSEKKENVVSLFNSLAFDRADIAVIDGETGVEGKTCQTYIDVNGAKKTAVSVNLPALAAETVCLTAPKASESAFRACGNKLSTPYYEVEFDGNGYIASLKDKAAGREIRKNGGEALGVLWFGEEMPDAWDNWDIDNDVFQKLKPVTNLLSREVVSDGGVEYRVRAKYALTKRSTVIVDTVFYAENRRVDFEVQADWQERHGLLKAGFNVNIRSAFVKNEIQFGNIDRPTTRNNPVETAKFEVCNHRWSDISETRYGVAILNDCKYGISAEDSDLRLTLLKGGVRPDPVSDLGVHSMTYSLLPHEGAFGAENVVRPAYALNNAVQVVPGAMKAPELFEIGESNIICEAVKNAEDVKGAYVLRLYECERSQTRTSLVLKGAKRAFETNMLEEKQKELALAPDGSVSLVFRPFEIKTILVER